jgi:hypothetical protein
MKVAPFGPVPATVKLVTVIDTGGSSVRGSTLLTRLIWRLPVLAAGRGGWQATSTKAPAATAATARTTDSFFHILIFLFLVSG